jgi:hypothetical protein
MRLGLHRTAIRGSFGTLRFIPITTSGFACEIPFSLALGHQWGYVMGSGQRLHVTLRLCYVDGQVEVDLDDSLFKLSAVLLLYVRF